MLIKRIIRRPLPALLIMLLMSAGVLYAAFTADSVQKNSELVRELYDKVDLSFQILPGRHSQGIMQIPLKLEEEIEALPQVAETFYIMECPCAMRQYEEEEAPVFYTAVCGTNNFEKLEQESELSTDYGENYGAPDISEADDLCLVSAELAGALHISVGDSIYMAGCLSEQRLEKSAPFFMLKVAGIYSGDVGTPQKAKIIVSDKCFSDNTKLIYSTDMGRRWSKGLSLSFYIRNEYNSSYKQLRTELENIVDEYGDYTLYCKSREIELSILPLEQKIEAQLKVFWPIILAVAALSVVVAVFSVLSLKTDFLIRMLLGEKYRNVFISEWLYAIGELILADLPAVALAIIFIPGDPKSAGAYAALFSLQLLLAFITVPLSLRLISRGNLVKIFQANI